MRGFFVLDKTATFEIIKVMEIENKEENWIDKMIEREALPPQARQETDVAFLAKWNVASSTYYYQVRKQENQKKIIKLALDNAKKHAPEVLENLAERGKSNSRDAELYLKFILQLAEKTDITTDGKPFQIIISKEIAEKYDITSDTGENSTGQT